MSILTESRQTRQKTRSVPNYRLLEKMDPNPSRKGMRRSLVNFNDGALQGMENQSFVDLNLFTLLFFLKKKIFLTIST